jgi:hypothetical protein
MPQLFPFIAMMCYILLTSVTYAELPQLLPSVCYKEYLTIFHWLNTLKSEEYSYDLGTLCGLDRQLVIPFTNDPARRNWTIFYAIGGNISTFRCNPRWSPTYFSGGSFIQTWDWDKSAPSGVRTDPETNVTGPTSRPCEILAHDRPEFDLIDETNPATGGIRLTYSALPEPAADSNTCPFDPIFNGPGVRSLRINLLCDPLGSIYDIKTDATQWSEYAACKYQLIVTTKAACGISGDPYAPTTSKQAASVNANNPGKNFGFTTLGSVLAVASYLIFRWADARGLISKIQLHLPSSLGDAGYNKSAQSSGTSLTNNKSPTTLRGAYGSL